MKNNSKPPQTKTVRIILNDEQMEMLKGGVILYLQNEGVKGVRVKLEYEPSKPEGLVQ